MLKGTNHPPDKIVGSMRPTAFREAWEFTVEKVAVNAVMAGARPEYLPVILALAASGITARSSSTTSLATISVVNGPIRNEIGMNSGIGAMGPYNHANATIGRAYSLLSIRTRRAARCRARPTWARSATGTHYSATLRGSRGAQPMAAVPRATGLQADRQHGQRILRRLVHPFRLRPARNLEGKIHPLPDGGRSPTSRHSS